MGAPVAVVVRSVAAVLFCAAKGKLRYRAVDFAAVARDGVPIVALLADGAVGIAIAAEGRSEIGLRESAIGLSRPCPGRPSHLIYSGVVRARILLVADPAACGNEHAAGYAG